MNAKLVRVKVTLASVTCKVVDGCVELSLAKGRADAAARHTGNVYIVEVDGLPVYIAPNPGGGLTGLDSLGTQYNEIDSKPGARYLPPTSRPGTLWADKDSVRDQ